MNLCVIPARGGSKRIPKKNIKEFCGKPLIAYSIETALRSKLFDRVIVSTDDEQIAEISQKFGAEIIHRPSKLADDFTTTGEVMSHAIKYLKNQGQTYDYLCSLYATAPLLKKEYLIDGFQKIKNSTAKRAFSVTSMPFPIQRTFKITKDGRCQMFTPEHFSSRSQDLEEAYQDAGQFYWQNLNIQSSEIPFGKDSIPIVIPRYLVQDIDTLEDWKRAELMYQALNQDKYDKWNHIKKRLESKTEQIEFNQGDISIVSVGENIGHEINGEEDLFLRPVLIYKKLSANSFLGVPLSSKSSKKSKNCFVFQHTPEISKVALLDQIRVFDAKRIKHCDRHIESKDFEKLKDRLGEFLDITSSTRGKR